MQLREQFDFDVRHAMHFMPADGDDRYKLRRFTLNPRVSGRARSVKAFAKDLGFEVREVNLPHGQNGRLVKDAFAERGFAIEVNASLSVEAKRFAVLHEMGHFYRHADREDPLFDSMHFDLGVDAFYVDESKEREANEFAEALLFGDAQLSAAVGLNGYNVARLAAYFGVTERVVAVALAKLKKQGGAAR